MIKLVLLVVIGIPLFGQSSGITVTASRNTSAQADLALFSVEVLTDVNASRGDVLAVLQGSIVTAASFSNIRTVQQYVQSSNQTVDYLDWGFLVTAPIGNFKATVAQLTALQQIVAKKKNGIALSFSVQGTGVSPQAEQSATCSTPDLMADARAQAQKMATAAGVSLGGVLAVSGATASRPATGGLFSAPVSYPLCFLTVKFATTGF